MRRKILTYPLTVLLCLLVMVAFVQAVSQTVTPANLPLYDSSGNLVVPGELDASNINISGNMNFNQGQAVNMTVWSGTSFPTNVIEGQPFYRTDLDTMYYYNGSAWVIFPSIGGGSINGTYTLPFTYIVFKSGSTYYAESPTGGVPYSSSLAYTTWDNAISATNAAGGGTVFGRSAVYTVTQNIIPMSNVNIQGEAGTIFRLANGVSVANFLSDVFCAQNDVANITFNGITIDGNMANNLGLTGGHQGVGIEFASQAQHVRIQNCKIQNCRNEGVLIRATSSKVSYDDWVQNSEVDFNGYNDIQFLSYDATGLCTDGHVVGNYLGEGTGDISVSTWQATGSANNTVTNIVVEGNTIRNMNGVLGSSTPGFSWLAIKFEFGSYHCSAKNNVIDGVCSAIEDSGSGAGDFDVEGNIITLKSNGISNVNTWFVAGIYLNKGFNTIQDNHIYFAAQAFTSSAYAMYIPSSCANNTVCGNYIEDFGDTNATTGIRSWSNYNIVGFNRCVGVDTTISESGSGNLEFDNMP